MKKPKTKNTLNPNWNTTTDAPPGKEHLNQHRLAELEKAKKKKRVDKSLLG